MKNRSNALESAKRKVLTFLEEEEGITDVGAFYQYAHEETYILEVFITNKSEWEFLKRLDPVLTEIADNNDFIIGVLPLPAPTT
jgi:hypothetical protein